MKKLNVKEVKFKHLGNSIDLDIKSPYILISSNDSGDGKSYLFEALRNHLRFTYKGKLASFNYQNTESIDDVVSKVIDDENALLLLDSIELIDSKILDSLKVAQCQVIMIGRMVEPVKLGGLNRAMLNIHDKNISLTYPFLNTEIENEINSLRGKRVIL